MNLERARARSRRPRHRGGADRCNAQMRNTIKELISWLGEDPERDGLLKTPERVERSFKRLTAGYRMNPEEIIKGALFEESCDEMVIVKDIDLFSLCEHHLLPFYGKASVGYIPNGRIVGLSKIPRLLEVYARRLQLQERLTAELAEALYRHLRPKGVGVVVRAYHMCMMMRGVEKSDSLTVTSSMFGNFKTDPKTRQEFLTLLK